MSSVSENKPPDILLYRCHKNNELKTYVCLICGEGYHTSCFERLSPVVYIKGGLVICNKHTQTNVLSKDSTSSATNEQTIIEVMKEQLIEMRSRTHDYERLTQHNNTLIELNVALKENIQLLKEKMAQKSYSETVKLAKPVDQNYAANTTDKTKKTPSIIISSNKYTEDKIAQIIKEKVNPVESHIGIKQFKVLKKKKTIKMACQNEEENTKLEELLKAAVPTEIRVEKEILKNPRLKVVNIQTEHTHDSLKEAIVGQNIFDNENPNISIIHITQQKHRQNSYTAYIEVDPISFRAIMGKSKLNIGWETCRVYEDFNLNRCFKCNGYYHSKNKCEKSAACLKCGESNHKMSECHSLEPKCSNCLWANNKYKEKYPTNHAAHDTNHCHYYKAQVEKIRASTNYNV